MKETCILSKKIKKECEKGDYNKYLLLFSQ